MTPPAVSYKSDTVCVYIAAKMKNPRWIKFILIILNIIVFLSLLLALFYWIPALLLIAASIEFGLGRYTLWNIYGREILIINDRSFSYEHYYGYFTTPINTQPISKGIHIKTTSTVVENNETYHYLAFATYDDNNLPVTVYPMALPILEADLKAINKLLDKLSRNELTHFNQAGENHFWL